MKQHRYKNVLVRHAKSALNHLGADIFHQDNDPKHKAKKLMSYINGTF